MNAKVRVLLIMSLLVSVRAMAQFDAQSTFYMNFASNYNPGAVGDGNLMKVSGDYRLQWVGIKNAPKTGYFSFQSPFVLGKTRHGAGVRMMTDKIGLFDNTMVYAQYAYKQKLGKGYLSIGADLGLVSLTFHGDSVSIPTGDDVTTPDGFVFAAASTDPKIPTSKQSAMQFDMGLGVYYSTDRWYAGLSYSHVTSPKLDLSGSNSTSGDNPDATFKVSGTMYAVGGYAWHPNRKFGLLPSALLKTDFRSWALDMTLLMEIRERFRPGLTYRWGDALGFIFEADIINGLELGYAYELPVSKILLASSGTHEVYIAYGFDILRKKRTQKYKSIRIL